MRVFVLFAALSVAAGVMPVGAAGTVDPSARLQRVTRLSGGPRRPVLAAALAAYTNAIKQGAVPRTRLLTVIDYSLPSTQPRLWVLDLDRARILYKELVAHGRESGDDIPSAFSNAPGSLMSSLGFFVTDEAYVGKNGYSLRLRGLDPGINDNAYDRAIVMHGAAYVNRSVAETLGRLGRSLGCPAVRLEVARKLIDTIKGGTAMYAYGVSHEIPAGGLSPSSQRSTPTSGAPLSSARH